MTLRFSLFLLALLTLAGCAGRDEMPEEQRNEFAERFLVSVRDDTAFYKPFLMPYEEEDALMLRRSLAKPWRFVRWDGPFMDDEGIYCLGDGSSLNLLVSQTRGRITGVGIGHTAEPCARGSEDLSTPLRGQAK